MKSFINWSGGKDSSLCLFKAQNEGLNIQALLTSVNKTYDRISMHGVRRALLEKQASSLQLPLFTIELQEQPEMEEYQKEMHNALNDLKEKQFTHSVFGDIFLEDLRSYRELQCNKAGFTPLFPLWKMDSHELIKEFISLGFKAIVVCTNDSLLDKSFCGRYIDRSFIEDLPAYVDPCGENGEYHSFVFDGPNFSEPIHFNKGEIIRKVYKSPFSENNLEFTTTFYFCDLLVT